MALSTSWRSTFDTTSNDESAILCSFSRAESLRRPRIFKFTELLLLFHLHLAGCPSGQRELTVNQPSSTSWVQIPHPPRLNGPDRRRSGPFCLRCPSSDERRVGEGVGSRC